MSTLPSGGRRASTLLAVLAGLLIFPASGLGQQQYDDPCDEEPFDPNALCSASAYAVPNFNTITVVMPFTGDDNLDASVQITYRKYADSAAYTDTGVVMTRVPGKDEFIGKIFWLTEGTRYLITLKTTDSDNLFPPVLTLDVTTRTSVSSTSNADTVYWVSVAGNDSSTGRSQGSPFKTIAKALSVMPENVGVLINVLPGVYHEYVDLAKNGTASKYNRLVAYSPADSTIIDGSDPTLADTTWTSYSGDVWYCDFSPGEPAHKVAVVVQGWLERLHRKTSLDSLLSNSLGPVNGWYVDSTASRLYVRLVGGANPNDCVMHISRNHQRGIRIVAKYWYVSGLTVRYCGGTVGSVLQPAGGGVLMDSLNSTHFAYEPVLRKVRSTTNGTQWCNLAIGVEGALIDSCRFDDPRIGTWSYFSTKNHWEETWGVSVAGYRCVVRGSTIEGLANGIAIQNSFLQGNARYGFGTDVHDCKISGVNDDGLEFESTALVAIAAWNNLSRGGNAGLATCPINVGPAYFHYNVFANSDHGLKIGQPNTSNTAAVFYTHNTFWSSGPFISLRDDCGVVTHARFRNNILAGRAASGSSTIITVGSSFGDTPSCSFDSDLFDTPGSSWTWLWNGTGYTSLAGIRSALGWENRGVAVNSVSYFADTSSFDYRPTSGSAPVDMGERVMGINTPHKTLGYALYSGYPDAGALDYTAGGGHGPVGPAGLERREERTGTPRRSGPRDLVANLAIVRSFENPSRGGLTRFAVVNTRPDTRLEVLEVTGRRVGSTPVVQGTASWEWRDEEGAALRPGLYFVRAVDRGPAGERRSEARKILLIR